MRFTLSTQYTAVTPFTGRLAQLKNVVYFTTFNLTWGFYLFINQKYGLDDLTGSIFERNFLTYYQFIYSRIARQYLPIYCKIF